jgi:predicted ATPase
MMITRLYIDGFKSLRNIELHPGKLNVLVGSNGSGKSSVLQTLLLLRQSAHSISGEVDELRLSGELYEAGMPTDAIHPDASHTITIEVAGDFNPTKFKGTFFFNRDDERDLRNRRLKGLTEGKLPLALFERQNEFSYLNAERIGPRVSYHLPSSEETLNGRVGKFGEFTAASLARAFNSNEVIDGWGAETERNFVTALESLDGKSLVDELHQSQGTIFRLSNIMLDWIIPGASFSATENVDTDSSTLLFERDRLGTKARVRTTHIGFGLTYSLPILVASMSLPRLTGLLLVENPEAHLHPYSQSRIGAFLALMSSTARQIFIETHSDHLVNGIRLAVRYGLVSAADVKIYYFDNSLAANQSKISSIELDSRGGLSAWPQGFFDQIERDLARL